MGLKIQHSLRNIKQNVYMAVLSLKERSISTDSKSFVLDHCPLLAWFNKTTKNKSNGLWIRMSKMIYEHLLINVVCLLSCPGNQHYGRGNKEASCPSGWLPHGLPPITCGPQSLQKCEWPLVVSKMINSLVGAYQRIKKGEKMKPFSALICLVHFGVNVYSFRNKNYQTQMANFPIVM